MKLVVTHEQPDFDALASVALAKLAHPGATAVITGSLSPRLRDLVRLYRDELNLSAAQDIELEKVTELIVVDTNDPGRIRPFDSLLGQIPVTLYDHHPQQHDSIRASRGVQDQVGATASILTRHLLASNTLIPPSIASLALLGIHEDTGHLTYPATAVTDHLAAAHLLASGANLDLVVEYAADPLSPDQRELLNELLKAAEVVPDGPRSILTASLETESFVPGISGIVSQLLGLYGADAALIAVGEPGEDTQVFARVARGYDASRAFLAAFGNGGHPGAAFARTELHHERALELALQSLKQERSAEVTAADIMSWPVLTVPEDSNVAQALQILKRDGHNGAPVTDAGGHLTGMVSRRDLEHAIAFDMDSASVTGVMNRNVHTAAPGDGVQELEARLIRHAIGRLPVVTESGQLAGIVTRTDLIAARHSRPRRDEAQRAMDRLPATARDYVGQAAGALPEGASLYLVGGTVRDALLGRSLVDLDLAVEGVPAQDLAAELVRRHGGRLSGHETFGTTTILLPDGNHIDIAGTRSEQYRHPGALPMVQPGSIRRDLQRRDYTINAMAVRIAPGPLELLDPHDGLEDLKRRLLRLLHPLSFTEDPTRIVRGARLAGRLGFSFAPGTAQAASLALTDRVLTQVAPARFRNELQLGLAEPRVAPFTAQLASVGALEGIYGLNDSPELLAAIDQEPASEVRAEASLLALLLDSDDPAAHINGFSWPQKLMLAVERLAGARQQPEVLTEEAMNRMSEPELLVARLFSEEHRQLVDSFSALPARRRLRGSDVVALGVPAGPQVGQILAEVARARQAGKVASFEAEIALARSLLAGTSGVN